MQAVIVLPNPPDFPLSIIATSVRLNVQENRIVMISNVYKIQRYRFVHALNEAISFISSYLESSYMRMGVSGAAGGMSGGSSPVHDRGDRVCKIQNC